MVIAVASGKGGTGKTTVAVNLAYALSRMPDSPGGRPHRVRLLDCDVDAPNVHLFSGATYRIGDAVAVTPHIDTELCTHCGACAQICRYHALAIAGNSVLTFPELCHGCGACGYICPVGAISDTTVVIGSIGIADASNPVFIDGRLRVGEVKAPEIIRQVKTHIGSRDEVTILDAPPGTACNVVETLSGCDQVLLVTEPTPFGLHDLKLAVNLVSELEIPAAIVINRSNGRDESIVEFSREARIPIAGRIPFRREYAEAYSDGVLLVDRFPELEPILCDLIAGNRFAAPEFRPNIRIECRESKTPVSEATGSDVREVAVISGKGGTGKTTLSASLCAMYGTEGRIVICDTDVDASDLHLLLSPHTESCTEFQGGETAVLNEADCTGCLECVAACRFDAIRVDDGDTSRAIRVEKEDASYTSRTVRVRIDPLICEGCGLCMHLCPEHAVSITRKRTGMRYESRTTFGPMVHAALDAAEENSGRLVTDVRKAARNRSKPGDTAILQDGPPGIGCPAIAAITGVHLVVIVTEPTVSGMHDLKRAVDLTRHFGLPAGIVVNKADLNTKRSREIETYASDNDLPIFGLIPFDPEVEESINQGIPLVLYNDGPASRAVRAIGNRIKSVL